MTMSPSVLFLYPKVSASLSPHQRSCFLKQMGVNTDTRQTKHRESRVMTADPGQAMKEQQQDIHD